MNPVNKPQVPRQRTGNGVDTSHALQGALLAFSRPPLQRNLSTASVSARTVNGIYYAQAGGESGQVSMNQEGAGSILKDVPKVRMPAQTHRGISPNKYEAAVAAARSKPVPVAPQAKPARLQEPVTKASEPQEEAIPSPGNVGTLTDKFESLDTAASTQNLKRVEAVVNKNKPTLGLDTEFARIVSARTPIEIHSPKPVKPISAVAPIEAVAVNGTTTSVGLGALQSAGEESFAAVTGKFKPDAPPPRRSTTRAGPQRVATSSTAVPRIRGLESLEALDLQRPALTSAITSPTRLVSVPSEFRTPQIPKRGSVSGLNNGQLDARRVDSLANAIVGAQLASSRVPSPAKSLNQWQSDKILYPEWPMKPKAPISRTPSPKKTMRRTLREPPLPVKVDGDKQWHRERSHFHLRKHPNKHHEGNRKRWRDEITEEERKRYEGVWAANRGIYVTLTDEELRTPGSAEKAKSYVSGLVVKDIWSRSRLTPHELEEIWHLVDKEGLPRLTRERFVVGMWLIDQRLKGRKLPTKVGDSIWHSVRGIYGLKVPKLKDRNGT